jgi:hypothetical protein
MAPVSDRTATRSCAGPRPIGSDRTAPRPDRPRNDTTRPPGPPALRRILTALAALAVALAAPACRTAPETEGSDLAAAPDGRAKDVPESLRCKQAADCVQKPSCYWETPACVASSDLVAEKCGEDADPKNKDYPPVECACFEGQCTTK